MAQPFSSADWPRGPAEPPAPGEQAHLWLADAGALAADSDSLLRVVLGRYLGVDPAAVRLDADPGGKPRLAERPQRLRFNLSHSGELVLVGVAAAEIGVDVQRVEPRRRHLAERRLGDEAAAAVRDADVESRAAVFSAHWARFEARQKCLGIGVFEQPPAGAEISVGSLDVGPGYAAAFALAAGRLPPARRFRLEL